MYENSEGYLHIIIPDLRFKQPKETEESSVGRLHSLAIPDVASFILCRPEDIPTDLTFRDAWKQGDKSEPIKIDFSLALEIHRKRLKEACQRKISKLEIERQIAIKMQNTPLEVSSRRTIEILRTLHEMNLTHCKSLEDIKYSIPKELHDVWDFYDPKK